MWSQRRRRASTMTNAIVPAIATLRPNAADNASSTTRGPNSQSTKLRTARRRCIDRPVWFHIRGQSIRASPLLRHARNHPTFRPKGEFNAQSRNLHPTLVPVLRARGPHPVLQARGIPGNRRTAWLGGARGGETPLRWPDDHAADLHRRAAYRRLRRIGGAGPRRKARPVVGGGLRDVGTPLP